MNTRRYLFFAFAFLLAFPAFSQTEEQKVNVMLNAWHKAAATADEDVFFGSMAADCIYIGTDKTERWLRDELKEWSKVYFDRDKAWDFTPIERKVYFDEKGKVAWFNETLDTWMGVCRSSGVLRKDKKKGWVLTHYHLSVTIDNDLINGFKSLIISNPVSNELRAEVLAPIKQLFDAMRESDSVKLLGAFAKEARLSAVGNNRDGQPTVRNDDIQDFANSIGTPHEKVYDERILDYDVRVDGNMAIVWTPYEFYVGDQFSHCGVNTFQIVKTVEGWKIWQVTDTRKKEGCK